MPSSTLAGIGRNLHLCFTKIKSQLPPDDQSPSAQLNRDDRIHIHPFLVKNYNSLYHDHHHTHEYNYDSTTSKSPTHSSSPSSEDPPDFAAVSASDRFFFSSPGRSNSIVESSPSIVEDPPSESSSTNIKYHSNNLGTHYDDDRAQESLQPTVRSVAVPTFSPDPYLDFRRSMQEMVEARDNLVDIKANWDYLHELLLCYLALNPKSTHKFIVSAFADLLVSLLSTRQREQADTSGRAESDESAVAGGCERSRGD